MSNAGHPKPVLCDNLAGGMGWGGRWRGVWDRGDTCMPIMQVLNHYVVHLIPIDVV